MRRSSMVRQPGIGPPREPWDRAGGPHHFFGLDVEEMAPRAQVVLALAVLAPVALSGLFLVAFVPGLWWIFTTYGWISFPAFGLLARGLSGAGPKLPAANTKERELLGTLREHGELTPATAAIETSLTVAEADGMLQELAEGGHLEVRVRGGGLSYALWGSENGAGVPRPGDQRVSLSKVPEPLRLAEAGQRSERQISR